MFLDTSRNEKDMGTRADIVAYSSDESIQLVVEVKAIQATTDEWAAKLRRNLVVHSAIPAAKFFLLALPDYLYLWCNNSSIESIRADFKIRTKDALRPYIENISLQEISGQGLEFLINSWLGDLINSEISEETAPPELRWIIDSGLYKSIRGGKVKAEVDS